MKPHQTANPWEEILESLPLTPTSQCSYFADRTSQHREFHFEREPPPELLETAWAKGFRRCGGVYYVVNCPSCNLCGSYRLDTVSFAPTRSQRRVLRRNADVACTVGEPAATEEKFEIYLRYQQSQHYGDTPDPGPERPYDADSLQGVMLYQMYCNPRSTREIELRLDGALVAFGIFDVALRSASAVYIAFDPDYSKRSPGTLTILHLVGWARSVGLRYVYLGYHIPGHPKMDYKSKFGPAQRLDPNGGQWE